MTQKIIAFVNQKGGVGKTTTVINVAAQIATDNHKVLLLDMDPQGNASSGLGIVDHQHLTTYDVICNGQDISEAIIKTHVAKLDILPSNSNLAGAEIDLVAKESRVYIIEFLEAT